MALGRCMITTEEKSRLSTEEFDLGLLGEGGVRGYWCILKKNKKWWKIKQKNTITAFAL